MQLSDKTIRFYIKPLIFLLALIPFGWLFYGAFTDNLGANPVEMITHETGDWGLRFLLLSLVISPLRKLTGINGLIKLRRMLGLFAFFYASLHLTTYVWLDQFFAWQAIAEDILKRPYITVGFAAWVLLLPLAMTSTNAMMRRLGRNWKKLHQLVYPAALLVVLHFLWLVKADYLEPMIYAVILLVLLLVRKEGLMRLLFKRGQQVSLWGRSQS